MEYGGYLPLELPYENKRYFDDYKNVSALEFDCARSALVFLLKHLCPQKIWIPYYNCEFVKRVLEKNNIPYEFYFLNNDYTPRLDEVGENEWLLYVNYFGIIPAKKIEQLREKYIRVIFDNTQAFFAAPVADQNCYSIYSCRKFFGTSDGAYLVCAAERCDESMRAKYEHLQVGVSWSRASYLLRSIEEGTNAAYHDSLINEDYLGNDILRMSALTKRILGSIQYEKTRDRRRANCNALRDMLGDLNQFSYPIDDAVHPMIYPFFYRNAKLRDALIAKQIYIPQWWKYLRGMLPRDCFESDLASYLLPLPIDQRYQIKDMQSMAEIIRRTIKEMD